MSYLLHSTNRFNPSSLIPRTWAYQTLTGCIPVHVLTMATYLPCSPAWMTRINSIVIPGRPPALTSKKQKLDVYLGGTGTRTGTGRCSFRDPLPKSEHNPFNSIMGPSRSATPHTRISIRLRNDFRLFYVCYVVGPLEHYMCICWGYTGGNMRTMCGIEAGTNTILCRGNSP